MTERWVSRRLCSLAAILIALILIAVPSILLAQVSQGTAPQTYSAAQAYREVLASAQGVSLDLVSQHATEHSAELDQLFDRLERSAYRYEIIPEFALAVVSAEAMYGSRISWARYDSWTMYELTTGTHLDHHPDVFSDLDTALSELRVILKESQTMEDVFSHYWCGPRGEFNQESLASFTEASIKLWNALEPYAKARQANEDRSKYTRDYYDSPGAEPAWAGLAYGDLEGYRTSLGAMPLLAQQIRSYEDVELQWMRVAQRYNSKLSDAEAIVIVRAILTYCDQTSWAVDPRLVMAIVSAESSFRPNAVSKVGAMGLAQLMPATAKSFGIRDPFDPIQNLYGCVKYLERERYRWRNAPNSLDLIIASYNAGAGAVQKYGGVPPYSETKSFVKIVKRRYFALAPDVKDQ